MLPKAKQKKYAMYGVGALDVSEGFLPNVFPREMGPNTMKYLKEVVDSGLTSDMVQRMEKKVAEIHGVKYCIGTAGCTQAIFATMQGMDFEQGDEIIMSAITDYGTVVGALLEGYIPVFADTEIGTGLISADTIEPLINERTKAIMVVHLIGLPCDMDPIMALAKKHNLIVIEDVCQAILAKYKGRYAGTIGDIGTYSFDAEKTCGCDIGGAVITDDPELEDRIRFRAIFRAGHIEPGFGRVHSYRGFPVRIPQCTAATVLANLEILPRQLEQRQKMAVLLDSMLVDVPGIITYKIPEDRTCTYWNYGFSVEESKFKCSPAEIVEQLDEAKIRNIGMCEYFLMPVALPFLNEYVEEGRWPFSSPPASRTYKYSDDTVPNARDFLKTWIRWFWTEKYQEEHIEYMANAIKKIVDSNLK